LHIKNGLLTTSRIIQTIKRKEEFKKEFSLKKEEKKRKNRTKWLTITCQTETT
jgi:hypothetical protein